MCLANANHVGCCGLGYAETFTDRAEFWELHQHAFLNSPILIQYGSKRVKLD